MKTRSPQKASQTIFTKSIAALDSLHLNVALYQFIPFTRFITAQFLKLQKKTVKIFT